MGASAAEEFQGLVEEWADLERTRTGSGGLSAEDAARRQHIERRLIAMISSDVSQDERREHLRLPCELAVQVRTGDNRSPGTVVDAGTGGVFLRTAVPAAVGDVVEIEVERRPGSLEHSFKVRGKVAWKAPGAKGGLGVALTASDDGAERRLRRFVIELLRKRY